MSDVLVLGAGAWGTALAVHAAGQGHRVSLWARSPARLGRENPRLPGVPLPRGVVVTGDVGPAAATLVAVPAQHLRAVLSQLKPPAPLVLCCKGLELGTGLLPLEVAAVAAPGVPAVVLTGPNFAHEIAAGLPAASVIAGGNAALRTEVMALLGAPAFRLYGNDDAVGAQLGGAAKNVVAIAAGAVTGAGLGENARAALITRGLAEIARLAAALGGRPETISGLSGLGDLMLTCAGPTSRNYALGLGLGQGRALAELLPEGGPVVEGVATAPALLVRAPAVDLPITRAVADLLAGVVSLPEAMSRLLSRPMKNE
jgi:glycerol-3-phosphate dehydrogenase (NAD(P)+)